MGRIYFKSNVPKGETRNATITFVVERGAAWAINNTKMTSEQIERIENFLEQISREVDEDKECWK